MPCGRMLAHASALLRPDCVWLQEGNSGAEIERGKLLSCEVRCLGRMHAHAAALSETRLCCLVAGG
jgi:hypothetical protein